MQEKDLYQLKNKNEIVREKSDVLIEAGFEKTVYYDTGIRNLPKTDFFKQAGFKEENAVNFNGSYCKSQIQF